MYRYYKYNEPIDPLFFYSIYVVYSSVANILMIGRVETNTVSSPYAYIIPEKIDISVMIYCLGSAFIFIGYDFFSKKSFPPIDVDIRKKSSLRTLFLILLLLCFQRFLFTDTLLGSFATLLSVSAVIGIVFFTRLWARYENKTYRNYAMILFAVKTIIALLFATLRSDIILPTLSLFLGYFLGKGNWKILFSYRMLPFVGAFLVFNTYFALFGENRSEVSTGFGRLTELNAISKQEDFVENDEKENVLERSSILPQLTNVVNLVDTRGFFNGDASAPLLIALVPRILWPEKPIIGLGAWFATEIDQGMQTESWYTNSINMTIPGHLYLDFGFAGVLIGCFLVGALLVCIWNATRFYQSPYNISGVTLGGYMFLISLQGIGADLQIAITLLAYYLIFLGIKKFV